MPSRSLERIVGDPHSDGTQALLKGVRDGYRPFRVVAWGEPGSQSPAVPLLQDRGLAEGRAAAYECRTFACQAPVVDAGVLRTQLAAG